MSSKMIIPTAEGGHKHVYPTQIVICAQGGKPLPEAFGLADPWSLHVSLRKRPCAESGEPITFDGASQELPEQPIGPIAVADLLHDPEVQQVLAGIMSVTNRLIAGELKPLEADNDDLEVVGV